MIQICTYAHINKALLNFRCTRAKKQLIRTCRTSLTLHGVSLRQRAESDVLAAWILVRRSSLKRTFKPKTSSGIEESFYSSWLIKQSLPA